ncbi:puff-specific protein Bx42 [Histomonas meleagridis]|uniref:puff-specific protein Bx42 n=1 Tax=Histomonas meleagridis TaxID=135588 RepID=UPI0035593F61|nr:puff-specific protein Bx42 [Histomonas meleagridis]KAH0804551.1 puff-specific protein Bx42 [Histomonas meleagridis]
MSLLTATVAIPRQQPNDEAKALISRQLEQSVAEVLMAKTGPVKKNGGITTIKYHNNEKEEYVVRVAEKRVDPLDPSRFRNRKPISLQKEDPAPILTAPTEKLTEDEQRYWAIPVCVSNWRNPEGYVIPMDKRVGADARRFEQPQMSDKFTVFTKALEAASMSINESIAQRNLAQRQLAQKLQREEEEKMVEEARRLNEEKRQINRSKTSEEKRVDRILEETKEQRRRMKRQRQGLAHRDTAAQAALGLPILAQTVDDEFDPQLFNKSSGVDTGYGTEDSYDVYDRPITGMGATDNYVPFAGDRAFSSASYSVAVEGGKTLSDRGSGYTVKFKPGEKQMPDQRSGLYFPNKADASDSD